MLNYEFPPLGGGAGNATYYLLKEFSKEKDLKIDLITSSTGSYKEEQFAENIHIYYLDIGKKGSLHSQSIKDLLMYSWKAYWFAKKLINKNCTPNCHPEFSSGSSYKPYDLVHAFFGVPCGYIAMKLGLPYVVSLRGSDVPGYNPKFKIVYKLLNGVIRKVWQNARYVIANSEDLKNTALKFYHYKKIGIIQNGVDCDSFSSSSNPKKDNIFRILYVGRFHERKRIHYLIEAFKQFSGGHSDTELVLVGEGELYDQIIRENQNNSQIKIIGRKEQKELIPIYQNSDVFVLPSLIEGMSNALLEAMASGLAIIATDTGGVGDLIDGNGIIIKSKNSDVIYEALNKLYDDRALVKNMKYKSLQLVGHMSWKKAAEKYNKIYKNTCAA